MITFPTEIAPLVTQQTGGNQYCDAFLFMPPHEYQTPYFNGQPLPGPTPVNGVKPPAPPGSKVTCCRGEGSTLHTDSEVNLTTGNCKTGAGLCATTETKCQRMDASWEHCPAGYQEYPTKEDGKMLQFGEYPPF